MEKSDELPSSPDNTENMLTDADKEHLRQVRDYLAQIDFNASEFEHSVTTLIPEAVQR